MSTGEIFCQTINYDSEHYTYTNCHWQAPPTTPICHLRRIQIQESSDEEQHRRDYSGGQKAAEDCAHRIRSFAGAAAAYKIRSDDGRQNANTAHHQWENDPCL